MRHNVCLEREQISHDDDLSRVMILTGTWILGSRSVVVASFETYPQSGRALIQTYFSDLLKRIPRITVLKADLLKRIPRF